MTQVLHSFYYNDSIDQKAYIFILDMCREVSKIHLRKTQQTKLILT